MYRLNSRGNTAMTNRAGTYTNAKTHKTLAQASSFACVCVYAACIRRRRRRRVRHGYISRPLNFTDITREFVAAITTATQSNLQNMSFYYVSFVREREMSLLLFFFFARVWSVLVFIKSREYRHFIFVITSSEKSQYWHFAKSFYVLKCFKHSTTKSLR